MIILAGFEKFAHYKINLSEIVVKNFKNQILGHQIQRIVLPVSWKRSIFCYNNIISRLSINPHLVILLGIHSGSTIRIERYSWNFALGVDEDNKFHLCPISLTRKIRINTEIDIQGIKSLKSDTIKIEFSSFMGLFLCNYVYFNAMLISANKYPVIFIHIPNQARLGEIIGIIKKIMVLMLESLKIRNS